MPKMCQFKSGVANKPILDDSLQEAVTDAQQLLPFCWYYETSATQHLEGFSALMQPSLLHICLHGHLCSIALVSGEVH